MNSSHSHDLHTSVCHIDRLSNLPDKVTGQILSRLPTRQAVRTSVLSQVWENKWTFIHDIDIDHTHDTSMDTFTKFVIRVLYRTSNSALRSFHLSWNPPCSYDSDLYLDTHISEVLRRNVQNLTILASENYKIESTRCFYGWTSLVECNLSIQCILNVPVDNCCPNLKKLRLAGFFHVALKIKNQGVNNTRGILLSFPVLEVLELKYCEWLDVDFVEIQAPELIEFKTYCLPEFKSYEIKIFGPKLDRFESNDGTINNFVVSGPSVTCVALNHYAYDHDLDLLDSIGLASDVLIKAFPNVECLKLSPAVVNALIEPSMEIDLPAFDQLKELELLCGGHIKDAMMLLQALPPLESLTLQLSSLDKNEQWEHLKLKVNISLLKKVTFNRFIGTESQYGFAKFILEKARKLKRMHLPVRSEWVKQKIKTRLSEMKPKGSSCVLDVVVQEPVLTV